MSNETMPAELFIGIRDDLTNAQYHAGPGISKSDLDQVAKSPAHWITYKRAPRKQTEGFSVGTEAHTLILEPDGDEPRAILKPDLARRSKADKALWSEFFMNCGARQPIVGKLPAGEWDAEFTRQTGRYLLTQEQIDEVHWMRDSVFSHPSAQELFEDGIPEQSVYWTDEDTKELCKCRPDWVYSDCVLVDLKTTDDASKEAFSRTIARYRYHVQNAFYSDGWQSAKGLASPPPFVFVVVENAPPYAVGVYELPEDARRLGRELYRRDLQRLAEAKRTNTYPAYSDKIETVDLPGWAYYTGENT